MGYRDEVIRRMKESGEWDDLPADRRKSVEQLDEQLARRLLVLQDESEANGQKEETEALGFELIEQVLRNLMIAFDGKLISFRAGERSKLTKLGRALAKFVSAARASGFKPDEIATNLSSLTWYSLCHVEKLSQPKKLDDDLETPNSI